MSWNYTDIRNKLQSAWWKIVTYMMIAPFCAHFGKHSNIVKPLTINGSKWINIGNNTRINSYGFIVSRQSPEGVSLLIGNNTTLGHFNHIVSNESVIIEDNVLTADRVFISDCYHGYEDIETPIIKQKIRNSGAVVIGEGSWIGENVSIIGCKIGKHCVIGANSVVIKDIPDYCLAAGNPAKVIKKYNQINKQWSRV